MRGLPAKTGAAAAGLALLAWGAVAVVADEPALRWAAVVAAWCTVLAAAVGSVVLVADRRSRAREARLERLVGQGHRTIAENHKRASVWNFHLTQGLGLGTPPAAPSDVDAESATGESGEPLDWPDDAEQGTLRNDVVTLVVAPTATWDGRECVRLLRGQADEAGHLLQVVVVDRAPDVRRSAFTDDDVDYLHLPGASWESAATRGSLLAVGGRLLLLDGVDDVRPGAFDALLTASDDPEVHAVQALVVDGADRIASGGRAFVGDPVPVPLLAGHPADDAASLADVGLRAVDGRAMATRTAWFRRLRGFDPELGDLADVDLCLRGAEDGRYRVVPDAVMTRPVAPTPSADASRALAERWRGRTGHDAPEVLAHAGFAVARVDTDGGRVPRPRPVVVRRGDGRGLRWGIKIASPGGSAGDRWGDTHFAASLREAFHDGGHQAVVHRHGAHATEACGLDDVSLVVRGKYRVNPMPGQVNVLWVISHPENVTVQEVRDYDLVFAASEPWALEMSRRSGRPVRTLLQATDPRRFHPDVEPVPVGRPIFVGGRHPGRDRLAVSTAVRTGTPLAIFGPGWDEHVPSGTVSAAYVPNDELVRYYRGATVVLADHWPEMAEHGFVQNRVFDAVAAGCRVVCDPVDGVQDLFGGAVQAYRDDDEFRSLCDGGAGAVFPDDRDLAVIAREVRRDHSFSRRVEQLAAAVREHRAARNL